MRLLTTAIATLLIAAAACAQTSRVWYAKLPDKEHSGMSVVEVDGQVQISADQVGPLFVFEPSAITNVVYSSESYRRSTKAYNYFDQRNAGNDMLAALAMALTAPFGKSKKHIVDIQWRATSEKESKVSLEIKGEDYVSFLDWLTTISGKKWVNLDDETREAEAYIGQHAASAFRVKLKDPVVGAVRDYYVLPIELNGKTDLYFFQGAVKAKGVSGIMPVTAEFRDNRCIDAPQALYGDCRGNSCELEAVVLPTITFRVTPLEGTSLKKAVASTNDCEALRLQNIKLGADNNSDDASSNQQN